MAYRNSVAIVENCWNEVWKQAQTPVRTEYSIRAGVRGGIG